MKVNVVCRGHGDDRILPRLSRILAKENAWTLSETPTGVVQLNAFASYINFGERHSDFHATHTSAYFTHFEKGATYKEMWWLLCTKQIDLRICTAPMYAEQLEQYGPTVLVRPPINPAFAPVTKERSTTQPIIGVSGFVSKRGPDRKGTKLVSKLIQSKLGKRITVVATGRGWPVPTQLRKLEQLPAWFNSLDVFLCTSNIEGIPMPPLEAIASGIPVVIPRDVGLLNSLPSVQGIYHYDKGDFLTMTKALEQAIEEAPTVDREKLREAVAEYTPENWALDHRMAFENLLANVPKGRVESSRHGKRGMYCVAFGEPARKCAKAMMESFREFMPKDIEIAVASDRPIGPEDLLIKEDDVDIGGRHAKTRIYDLIPKDWNHVLYLDADIEIFADISYLYEALDDGWDFVICTNPSSFHVARRMVRVDNRDECERTFRMIGTDEVIQLNGGVFSFQRNQRTAAFFRKWHEEWGRWGKRDQAALLRALWQHPLKMYVLTNVWNCITRYVNNPRQYSAGVLHYPMTSRRWRGIVKGRSDSKEAWEKVKLFKQGKK